MRMKMGQYDPGAPDRGLRQQIHDDSLHGRALQPALEVRDQHVKEAARSEELSELFAPSKCVGTARESVVNSALRFLYLGPMFSTTLQSPVATPRPTAGWALLMNDVVGSYRGVWLAVDFRRAEFWPIDADKIDLPSIPVFPQSVWIPLRPAATHPHSLSCRRPHCCLFQQSHLQSRCLAAIARFSSRRALSAHHFARHQIGYDCMDGYRRGVSSQRQLSTITTLRSFAVSKDVDHDSLVLGHGCKTRSFSSHPMWTCLIPAYWLGYTPVGGAFSRRAAWR